MSYQLSNQYPKKRAFITGGGGALGKSFALLLAKDGWTIGITDISDKALDAAKQAVESAGGKALTYQFDVSNKAAYKTAFDEFVAKNGGIDLLINNAGIGDGGLFGV